MNLSDSLRLYLKENRKVPLLKPEEEIELARKEELPASKKREYSGIPSWNQLLQQGCRSEKFIPFCEKGMERF